MIITDQIGHQFELKKTPKKIISLVPSQTELLYDLGLEERIIGITKFCIHPKEWFETKTRVGGTKTVNFEKITKLKPDLIIANKEENTQSEIEFLQKKYAVYTSDISNLDESIEMITMVGEITDKQQEAQSIISNIKKQFKILSASQKPNKSVLYFIWQNPYMSVGNQTFINDMLTRCGFKNLMNTTERYPDLNEEKIRKLNPEYIFLSSEPYPFSEKHKLVFEKTFPNSKIILVNGEYFSWYGSRLQNAPAYFVDLIEKMA